MLMIKRLTKCTLKKVTNYCYTSNCSVYMGWAKNCTFSIHHINDTIQDKMKQFSKYVLKVMRIKIFICFVQLLNILHKLAQSYCTQNVTSSSFS